MKKYYPFRTGVEANAWLTGLLLNRSAASSDRLLQSTKLCDLIFRALAMETDFNRPENTPVSPDALCADLFTLLFSPVIRRKGGESIRLRERLFHQPIADRLVGNDRFKNLKALCEDRELVSFEAASAFTKAFLAATQTKPYHPKTDFLLLIEKLTGQVNQKIAFFRETNLSAQKQLRLSRVIYDKLCQIENLKRKAKEDALCYLQSIREEIDKAFENAMQTAAEVHSAMSAWGTESGTGGSIPANRELLDHVKNSEELLKIARSLGKYKEIIADKRKNGFSYGRGEKYDLVLGNDISDCLTSQLGLLGTPETEILFMRKMEQRKLIQYRKRTEVVKGKGDCIVLLDESGSTRSVQAWAKAFALALLDLAAKDRRKYALVHFSSAGEIKTDLFEPGEYTSKDVLHAAEHFFGGGTDFEEPLKEAKRLMENGYENADITIITDGECRISDAFAEEFRSAMRQHKATVTGILLDKETPCGKSLETFCDKIYHSKDITEDEIAVQILNRKAS